METICKNVATYQELCEYADDYVTTSKPFKETTSQESACGDYYMDLIVDELDAFEAVSVDPENELDVYTLYKVLYWFMEFHGVTQVTIIENADYVKGKQVSKEE